MPKNLLPIAGPSITKKEISYVNYSIRNNWYSNSNYFIEKFENEFKNYLGRKFAISLPSCTSGLHLSLLALGIGKGDEVIVPDVTWIASVAPVIYVGAKPIFCDIDKSTWCLSYENVKKAITKKTKAIIAVNLYGHMPDYDNLNNLGIPIIEDSAESIGSMYKNKLSGKFGITSCFSFHGSKTMTTGEGGMLVTDSHKLYKKCMILRDHGRKPRDIFFRNQEIGHKYKMTDLQAAIGLAQLERINELVEKKRKIFGWYESLFSKNDEIEMNPFHKNTFNSYWMTTILFKSKKKINKNFIVKEYLKHGISTRPFFSPLSSLKPFNQKKYSKININSYDISSRGINLPSAYICKKKDCLHVKNITLKIINALLKFKI